MSKPEHRHHRLVAIDNDRRRDKREIALGYEFHAPATRATQTTEGDTHYRVYVQAGDELAGTPEIWVVYVCTDNEIIILDIEAREADTAH